MKQTSKTDQDNIVRTKIQKEWTKWKKRRNCKTKLTRKSWRKGDNQMRNLTRYVILEKKLWKQKSRKRERAITTNSTTPVTKKSRQKTRRTECRGRRLIGSYIRSWERPGALPRVIEILCLFAKRAKRHNNFYHEWKITRAFPTTHVSTYFFRKPKLFTIANS